MSDCGWWWKETDAAVLTYSTRDWPMLETPVSRRRYWEAVDIKPIRSFTGQARRTGERRRCKSELRVGKFARLILHNLRESMGLSAALQGPDIRRRTQGVWITTFRSATVLNSVDSLSAKSLCSLLGSTPTVFPLIEAGSQIEAGGLTLLF